MASHISDLDGKNQSGYQQFNSDETPEPSYYTESNDKVNPYEVQQTSNTGKSKKDEDLPPSYNPHNDDNIEHNQLNNGYSPYNNNQQKHLQPPLAHVSQNYDLYSSLDLYSQQQQLQYHQGYFPDRQLPPPPPGQYIPHLDPTIASGTQVLVSPPLRHQDQYNNLYGKSQYTYNNTQSSLQIPKIQSERYINSIIQLSRFRNYSTQILSLCLWYIIDSLPIIALIYIICAATTGNGVVDDSVLGVLAICTLSLSIMVRTPLHLILIVWASCRRTKASIEDKLYFRFTNQFFKNGWIYDSLWCGRYYRQNECQTISYNQLISKYEVLNRSQPSLFFVISTYNTKEALDLHNKEHIPLYPWTASSESRLNSPSGNDYDAQEGETHLIPIKLLSYSNVSKVPSLSQVDNAYVDLSYTYTLHNNDQLWITQQISQLKHQYATQYYPYVHIDVRYMLYDITQSLISCHPSGFEEGSQSLMIRDGINKDLRTNIMLGAGTSYDQFHRLSLYDKLSPHGFGKGNEDILVINNDDLASCSCIGCIMHFCVLKSYLYTIFRLTTKYLWVTDVKLLMIDQTQDYKLDNIV